jgi:hypothetical protein
VAALLTVIVFRRNFSVELQLFGSFGLSGVPAEWPTRAIDWFSLLQENRLVGLLLFDLFDLINYALVGLIFLALYGALKGVNKSAMVVALSAGLVGIAVYFASNQAFSMLTLSNRYAAAAGEVERAMFLAAGESLLAIHNPGTISQGTGIHLGLLLVVLAGLIISIVMLRSPVFNKATPWMGIVANSFIMANFLVLVIGPAIAWLLPATSALFRMAWYILIATGLFRQASPVQLGDAVDSGQQGVEEH